MRDSNDQKIFKLATLIYLFLFLIYTVIVLVPILKQPNRAGNSTIPTLDKNIVESVMNTLQKRQAVVPTENKENKTVIFGNIEPFNK